MSKKESFIGYVPLDLYRLGRKEDKSMDRIRERDIKVSQFWRTPGQPDSDVRTGRPGEIHCIKGGPEGGISLFDDIGTAPISGKHWWGISIGKKIPPFLAIWGEKPRQAGDPKPQKAVHYTVYPLIDMPMDTFKIMLREFAKPMTPMFNTESKIQ